MAFARPRPRSIWAHSMGSRAAPHRSTTASSSARVEHLVHGDRAAVTDRHDARARHHGSGQHVVLPLLSFTDPCTIGRDPPPSIHRSPALRGDLRQARDTRRSGADGSAVRRPTGVSARRSPGTLGSKERPAWFDDSSAGSSIAPPHWSPRPARASSISPPPRRSGRSSTRRFTTCGRGCGAAGRRRGPMIAHELDAVTAALGGLRYARSPGLEQMVFAGWLNGPSGSARSSSRSPGTGCSSSVPPSRSTATPRRPPRPTAGASPGRCAPPTAARPAFCPSCADGADGAAPHRRWT